MTEITRGNKRVRRNVSISATGEILNGAGQIRDALGSLTTNRVDLTTMMAPQGVPNTRTYHGCNCLSCTSELVGKDHDLHKYTSCSEVKPIISALDIIQEDLESHCSEEYPREDDRYSVITNIEDYTIPKPVYDNCEDKSKDETPVEDQFCYDDVPEQERGFVRRILKIFRHCFSTKDHQRKIVRDSRTKLKVNLRREPENPRSYKSDSLSGRVLDDALRELVRSGVAKYAHQPVFFSPTFLRIRSSSEMDLLRKSRALGVNYKLCLCQFFCSTRGCIYFMLPFRFTAATYFRVPVPCPLAAAATVSRGLPFRFTAATYFRVSVPCPLAAAAATVSRGRRLASAAARGCPKAAKTRCAVK
jgi:hypothetical protein